MNENEEIKQLKSQIALLEEKQHLSSQMNSLKRDIDYKLESTDRFLRSDLKDYKSDVEGTIKKGLFGIASLCLLGLITKVATIVYNTNNFVDEHIDKYLEKAFSKDKLDKRVEEFTTNYIDEGGQKFLESQLEPLKKKFEDVQKLNKTLDSEIKKQIKFMNQSEAIERNTNDAKRGFGIALINLFKTANKQFKLENLSQEDYQEVRLKNLAEYKLDEVKYYFSHYLKPTSIGLTVTQKYGNGPTISTSQMSLKDLLQMLETREMQVLYVGAVISEIESRNIKDVVSSIKANNDFSFHLHKYLAIIGILERKLPPKKYINWADIEGWKRYISTL